MLWSIFSCFRFTSSCQRRGGGLRAGLKEKVVNWRLGEWRKHEVAFARNARKSRRLRRFRPSGLQFFTAEQTFSALQRNSVPNYFPFSFNQSISIMKLCFVATKCSCKNFLSLSLAFTNHTQLGTQLPTDNTRSLKFSSFKFESVNPWGFSCYLDTKLHIPFQSLLLELEN